MSVRTASGSLLGDGDVDSGVTSRKLDGDGDSDSEGGDYYDRDDEHILDYGHAASAAEKQVIVATVKRFYAASADDNGHLTCDLIDTALADAVPQEYGEASGQSVSRGATCATVMPRLLLQLHRLMSDDSADLRVGVVRVEGDNGYVLLSDGASWPRRYLEVRRERGSWKIATLLDESLP